MSSPEEWCRERLAKLQIKDLQRDTLSEIKDHLTKLPQQEAIETSNFLQLPAIFDCLDSSQSEQTKLACDVLSICMTNLDLGESVNNHSNLLEKSLYHENPNVQLLGLNELNRNVTHELSIISDTNLLIAAIKTIDSPDTGVGAACVSFLTKILPNFIEIGDIKSILENILIKSENLIKCRVYEVAVKLTKSSNDLIEKLDFILGKMIDDFKDGNDILYQLNLLEIMSDLAITEQGLTYLENKNCFKVLVRLIENSDESPLMTPGLIKFFGIVTVHQPITMFNRYPAIISLLLDCIITNDAMELPAAYDTLGCIGKSFEGKQFLTSIPGNKMKNVLKEFSSINSYPTELKIRALCCLRDLFSSDNPENNQISSIGQTWYSYLSETNDLNFISVFCKNPFPDIKTAGLDLLKSIVLYKWGQQYLYQTAGFIEYLLDRTVEFNQTVILRKFDTIKLLSDSKNFDHDTINLFKKYVMEGPVYIKRVTEVALEGAE